MRIQATAVRTGDRVRRPRSSEYATVEKVYPVVRDRSGNRVVRVSFGRGTGMQWRATDRVTVLRASVRRVRRPMSFYEVTHDGDGLRSSFIDALGYNSTTEQLRVCIGGRSYDYAGVSRHTFYRLRKAKSVGSYYSRNIRGVYDRTAV